MLTRIITRHKAGEFVKSGIYWSREGWDLVKVPEGGGQLPDEGAAGDYYGLPVLLVMLLAPIAGLAFILFLPVAVPLMVLYLAPRAIANAIRRRRGRIGPPAGMRR